MPDFRVRQRDYLLEISRAITEQLDLDEVLRRILRAAVSMLAGQVGLIALRDAGAMRVWASYGVNPALLAHFEPLLTDMSIDDDGSLLIPGLEQKLERIASEVDLRLRQVVALPMSVGDAFVGVIYIFRAYGGSFSLNDRRVLESFADQAAIAVHNARLYQTAERERTRLEAILESSADGVMILSPGLKIESFNRALSRITGWRADQAIGQPHDAVIVWQRREPGADLEEAVAGGWPTLPSDNRPASTLYVEGDLRRPDGTTISVAITYAPLIHQGRLVNIIANVRDITHFREAQEAKSTFISVISHELKTPVSLIKGYASTLRREDAAWDPATIQASLQVIEEEADRLTELIENLLEASRLQSGSFKLERCDVRLDQLAERVAVDFRTQTAQHTLTVDFPPDFPVVQGDERRLRNVLDNLVSNAIKYSPGGGEVRIWGQARPDEVLVGVSDQGVGLPHDELDRVFERFYRVNHDITRKTKGTGLGLYLAQAIVEAHGGRIWVESTPGHGATFTFALPR
ncbi:MAG: ATP-binding protein [Anaerolineae bacterium]